MKLGNINGPYENLNRESLYEWSIPRGKIKAHLKGDIGRMTSIIVEVTFSILGTTPCFKKIDELINMLKNMSYWTRSFYTYCTNSNPHMWGRLWMKLHERC
jgi:hypothetical protein